jgi:PAS domain S-box-containing protein
MNEVKKGWRFKSMKRVSSCPQKTDRETCPVTRQAPDGFLRALVDACVTSVAVVDEFGMVLYASRAWRLLESAGSATRGHVSQRFIRSCIRQDAPVTLAEDIEAILTGSEQEFHRQYYRPAYPNHQPFLIHGARLDLPGSIVRVLISREEVRLNSETRLAQLLDSTNILAWESVGELFTYVSDQAVGMLGYPVADWYGPGFFASHIHPEDREWVLDQYRKHTKIAGHFDITFRMVARDGHVVWIQNVVSVTCEAGLPAPLYGFMIDVSERRRAEKALRDLSGRLICAQEEERKRVARELHDDLNQRLGLVAIELSQLEDEIDNQNIRRHLQKTCAQIQQISTEVHGLSYKLHPSKLDHLGLASAIRGLCKEISRSGKLKVSFLERELPRDMPKDLTLCLFRITQEALRNCVKHSGAQSAHVYLRGNNNSICLLISDSGRGFDPSSELLEKGLGFVSMRERVHLVSGEIRIISKPHNGTRIAVSVPLKQEGVARCASRPIRTMRLLSSTKIEPFAGSEKVLVSTA